MSIPYTEESLRRLQSEEVFILKRFAEICEKYNIGYFVFGGTAIGAVRHGGFIPWDDDTDVAMLWEDYLKLRDVPSEEWGKNLLLCDPGDPNETHAFPYPRIYKTDTIFVPESFGYLKQRKKNNTGKYCKGVWLDIWIYHRFNSLEEIAEVQKKARIYAKEYLYSKMGKDLSAEKGLKRKLLGIAQNMYNIFSNVAFRDPEIRALNNYLGLFKNAGEIATVMDYPYQDWPMRSVMNMDDIFPLKDISFEGITLKMPNNNHKLLTNMYDDYMKIPPVEQRVTHEPEELEFDI